MRQKQTDPWTAIGMSRASWYRHGKPKTKPVKPPTQRQFVKEHGLKLRTIQRHWRVQKAANIIPDIAEQLEQVKNGKLSISAVENFIRMCLRLAQEEHEAVIHLPDLSK